VRIRAEQKEAIRAALLRAGVELIGREGFDAVTVEEITAQARVAKGTFFNYFKVKADLALAAVAQSHAEGIARGLSLLPELPHTWDRLAVLFREVAAWVESNPELTWIYSLERLRRVASPEKGDSHFRLFLTQILAIGQERGEVRTDRPALLMATDLEGLLLANIALWYFHLRPQPLDGVLGQAVQTYLHGAFTIPEKAGDPQP
jgi:AcrR family transcriptional regulator